MPRYVDHQERAGQVLEALVRQHIITAEPVSSEELRPICGWEFSSATLRNVLATLESGDYLAKRSSSGGRIPTDKGFRRYAQTADIGVELSKENQEILMGEIYRRGLELTEAISETSRILAVLSKLMALVVLPAASDQRLDRLEFVGLSRSRVLVILVTEDDMILEGIADLPKGRGVNGGKEIHDLSRRLNRIYQGRSLDNLKSGLMQEQQAGGSRAGKVRADIDKLSQSVVALINKKVSSRISVNGERNMLDQPEFQSSGQLAPVLTAVSENNDLLDFFTDVLPRSTRPQVLIGTDLPIKDMRECAVVVSDFEGAGLSRGYVGIVGPRRMPYGQVIPLIRFAASILSGRA